ncbi:MAG: oligosaccharide flippase family protein [Pseudomonadota bacterium]
MIAKIRKRLSAVLSGDATMKEALSQAKIAFVLRVLGAGLAFLFTSAVARLLGAEGAGLYFMALSVMMIAAVIGRLGLENTLLRFIAANLATGAPERSMGAFAMGMRWTVIATAALGTAVFVLAPVMAGTLFDEPAVLGPLRVLALGIVTFSLLTTLSFALKGLKKVGAASLVAGVMHPAIGLLIIVPMTAWYGATGAAAAYLTGTLAAAILGAIFWRRYTAGIVPARHPAPHFEAEALRKSARPLWVGQIVSRGLIPWAPVFIMGIWASAADTAVVGMGSRIALLIAILLQAVTAAVSPHYARLHATGELGKLARMMRRFSLLLTVAASPLFLIMVLFPTQIMSLFGEGFETGGAVLAILAVGQIVNTACGSVFAVLSMSGHERDVRDTTLVTAVTLIIACFVLIPPYGAVGAAMAMAGSIIVNNLLALVQVRRRLGIIAIPGPHLIWPDRLKPQPPKTSE